MKRSIVVAEFGNRLQAETTCNLLWSFGVHSWVDADDLGGIGPGQSFMRGVRVVVESEDMERAREILDAEVRRSPP